MHGMKMCACLKVNLRKKMHVTPKNNYGNLNRYTYRFTACTECPEMHVFCRKLLKQPYNSAYITIFKTNATIVKLNPNVGVS